MFFVFFLSSVSDELSFVSVLGIPEDVWSPCEGDVSC